MLRKCKDCGVVKDIHKFPKYKSKDGVSGYRHKCKECRNAQHKAVYKPMSQRGYVLKGTYGITLADYEALLEAQGYKCALCDTTSAEHTVGGKNVPLRVDHDHAKEPEIIIRALLCHKCNMNLGLLERDLEWTERALAYSKAGGLNGSDEHSVNE